MEKISIRAAVIGKGPFGVRLRLENGSEEWFNYGRNEKAAEKYKNAVSSTGIGDIVNVEAVIQSKDGKNSYFLRGIKPEGNDKVINMPAAGESGSASMEGKDLTDLVREIWATVNKMDSDQTVMKSDFTALKNDVQALSEVVKSLHGDDLSPSERARTALSLGTKLIDSSFTNGNIAQTLGKNLNEYSKNLKEKILPLLGEVSKMISEHLADREQEILSNNYTPVTREGISP